MSHSDFLSTLGSSNHDFITTLRFLDDYINHVLERRHHHQIYRNFVPRFDLEQHGDSYHLYGELPGFQRDDVTIEANDDRNLQVSGSIPHLALQPPPPRDVKEPENAKNGAKSSQDTPLKVDLLEATTTNEERFLNARFGDVLDPHAEFHDTKEEAPEGEPKIRRLISERLPCTFHRAFHFPTPIKKAEVTAIMQDGILHITAPRAPMPPPVKVHVRSELEFYPAIVS